jgi:hypothetical protein
MTPDCYEENGSIISPYAGKVKSSLAAMVAFTARVAVLPSFSVFPLQKH